MLSQLFNVLRFIMRKIKYEKRTVEYMIRLYCRKKHGHKVVCDDCRKLMIYTSQRLDKCPFGDEKPACRNCEVHCYKSDMRDKIQNVMRFSGPRMILFYPIDYVKHVMIKKPLKR